MSAPAHAWQGARNDGRFVGVVAATINMPVPHMPFAARFAYFLLSEDLRLEKRASRMFLTTSDDLELIQSNRPGITVETAERRGIPDGSVAKLRAQGLQPVGKGEAWYSYRFRRPAR